MEDRWGGVGWVNARDGGKSARCWAGVGVGVDTRAAEWRIKKEHSFLDKDSSNL